MSSSSSSASAYSFIKNIFGDGSGDTKDESGSASSLASSSNEEEEEIIQRTVRLLELHSENAFKNPIQATFGTFRTIGLAYEKLHATADKKEKTKTASGSIISALFDHIRRFPIYGFGSTVKTKTEALKLMETALAGVKGYLASLKKEIEDTKKYRGSLSSSVSSSINVPTAVAFANLNEKEDDDEKIVVDQTLERYATFATLRSTNQKAFWNSVTSIGSELFSPLAFMTCVRERPTRSSFLLERQAYYQSTLSNKIESQIRTANIDSNSGKSQRKGSDLYYFINNVLSSSSYITSQSVPDETAVRLFIRDRARQLKLTAAAPSARVATASSSSYFSRGGRGNRGRGRGSGRDKQREWRQPSPPPSSPQPQLLPSQIQTQKITIMDSYSVLLRMMQQFAHHRHRGGGGNSFTKRKELYSTARIDTTSAKWTLNGINELILFLTDFKVSRPLKTEELKEVNLLVQFFQSVLKGKPKKEKMKKQKEKEDILPLIASISLVKPVQISNTLTVAEPPKDVVAVPIPPPPMILQRQRSAAPSAGDVYMNSSGPLDKKEEEDEEGNGMWIWSEEKEKKSSDFVRRFCQMVRVHRWLLLSLPSSSSKKEELQKNKKKIPAKINDLSGLERTFKFSPLLDFNTDLLKKLSLELILPERDASEKNMHSMDGQFHSILTEAGCLLTEFQDQDSASSSVKKHQTWNRRLLYQASYLLNDILDFYVPRLLQETEDAKGEGGEDITTVAAAAAIKEKKGNERVYPHKWMAFRDASYGNKTNDALMKLPQRERLRYYGYLMNLYEQISNELKKGKPIYKDALRGDVNSFLGFNSSGSYFNHPLAGHIHTWNSLVRAPVKGWRTRLNRHASVMVNKIFQRYCMSYLLKFMCSQQRWLSAFDQRINTAWDDCLKCIVKIDTQTLFGDSTKYLGLKFTRGNKLATVPIFNSKEGGLSKETALRYVPLLVHVPPSLVLHRLFEWSSYYMQCTAIIQLYFSYLSLFHSRAHLDRFLNGLYTTKIPSDDPSIIIPKLRYQTVNDWERQYDSAVHRVLEFFKSSFLDEDSLGSPIRDMEFKGKETKRIIKCRYIAPIKDKLGQHFPVDHSDNKTNYSAFDPSLLTRFHLPQTGDEHTENSIIRYLMLPLIFSVLDLGHEISNQTIFQTATEPNARARLIDNTIFGFCVELIQTTLTSGTKKLQTSMDQWLDPFVTRCLGFISNVSHVKSKDAVDCVVDLRNHLRGGYLRAALQCWNRSPFSLPTGGVNGEYEQIQTLFYISSTKNTWTGGVVRPSSDSFYRTAHHNSLIHLYSNCIRQSTKHSIEQSSPLSSSS